MSLTRLLDATAAQLCRRFEGGLADNLQPSAASCSKELENNWELLLIVESLTGTLWKRIDA
jgi:hypothetical protein